jgi:hypothetical protein
LCFAGFEEKLILVFHQDVGQGSEFLQTKLLALLLSFNIVNNHIARIHICELGGIVAEDNDFYWLKDKGKL